MHKFLNTVFSLTLLTVCFSASLYAQNKSGQIPKEVSDIVGTYTGSWTSYGLDANGQVVKQAAWIDTLKAENPILEKNRAVVITATEMTFEGGRIPPMKVPGKEGYIINSDGSLGEYFIETFGQTYKMQKLGDNVLAYTVPVSQQELTRIGAVSAVSGHHVLVKVVTFEQGIETHNISRLTTVRWKDATGRERTTQFVSLQGHHKKQRS
jgi:hypothetical protein